MENDVLKSLLIENEKKQTREERDAIKAAECEARQKERKSEKIALEQQRRRKVAQIDRLVSASDKIITVFQRFNNDITISPLSAESPPIVVEKGELPTREKKFGMIGVRLGMKFSSGLLSRGRERLSQISERDDLDRLRLIDYMGAAAFQLPYDEDQLIGESLAKPVPGGSWVKLARHQLGTLNAAEFVERATDGWLSNHSARRSYARSMRESHTPIQRFHEIVDIAAQAAITSQSGETQ